MPADLTDVLDRVIEVTRRTVEPGADTVDREAAWPRDGIRALQWVGLGGLVVPERYGGLGHGYMGIVRVCEILGQACASTALCFGMHCVGAAVIAAKATADQKERYLDPISRGEHLTTLALSEPGTGVHFYIPQTRLMRISSARYRLSGVKSFVTGGGYCDSYVVSAVTDHTAPGEFSCVVVSEGLDGMAWGASWQGWGMRGNAARTLELRDVTIPRHDLLGEEGDQIWYVFNVVAPYFLAAMAGTYLGIATRALQEARSHLGQRSYEHNGFQLGQMSVLQHRLGVLWATVERTRRLIYHAALEADAGGPDALVALCAAKAEVGDCVVGVVNEAMTLCGGIAYRDGSRLERLMRDARAAHVMSPTTDLLRVWMGRALLGHPLLGE